jgi:hypothetical protein
MNSSVGFQEDIPLWKTFNVGTPVSSRIPKVRQEICTNTDEILKFLWSQFSSEVSQQILDIWSKKRIGVVYIQENMKTTHKKRPRLHSGFGFNGWSAETEQKKFVIRPHIYRDSGGALHIHFLQEKFRIINFNDYIDPPRFSNPDPKPKKALHRSTCIQKTKSAEVDPKYATTVGIVRLMQIEPEASKAEHKRSRLRQVVDLVVACAISLFNLLKACFSFQSKKSGGESLPPSETIRQSLQLNLSTTDIFKNPSDYTELVPERITVLPESPDLDLSLKGPIVVNEEEPNSGDDNLLEDDDLLADSSDDDSASSVDDSLSSDEI